MDPKTTEVADNETKEFRLGFFERYTQDSILRMRLECDTIMKHGWEERGVEQPNEASQKIKQRKDEGEQVSENPMMRRT